jgi:murein DD-endopeptidase MepM/ murein hydrolase activator NlpD
VSSRRSFRQARLAVAIVGLTTVVSCSGNSTSPTPQPTPVPTVPPETPSSTALLWPLGGRDGRDWVINNYVDLDATSGTLDYTGGSGSEAKTYNGHNGIDIDVPNFRWMDGNVSNVLAAASGVVTGIRDTEPDRNTSCTGSANFVQVRHPDGLTAVYAHLR